MAGDFFFSFFFFFFFFPNRCAQSITLSEKPLIETTMTCLPTSLLEQLLGELSTLASVYHKPPESFVGHGRYGAAEIQRAAIREQRQNAEENPIAASVAAAANGASAPQNNVENLLDIDFDGAAPASAEAAPGAGAGGVADMMGLFDAAAPSTPAAGAGAQQAQQRLSLDEMLGGFGGMNIGGASGSQAPAAAAPLGSPGGGQKKDDDLLGLF